MEEKIILRDELSQLYPDYQNLGELVSLLENDYYKKGEVICEISVNDIRLSETEESRFSATTKGEIVKISVKASPVLRLVFEASGSASQYIERLKEVTVKTADLFRTDDLAHAQNVFISLLEGTRWLSEMLLQIKNVSGSVEGSSRPLAWPSVEARYLDLILQTEAAFERRDFILTADILEYEWTEVLDSWLNLLKSYHVESPIGTGENFVGG